jgi:hypothetical protein
LTIAPTEGVDTFPSLRWWLVVAVRNIREYLVERRPRPAARRAVRFDGGLELVLWHPGNPHSGVLLTLRQSSSLRSPFL